MRTLGRDPATIKALPSADGLHTAAAQQQVAAALAGLLSTGIRKGVYRFTTPQQADQQRLEAAARVIAANAASLRRRHG